MSCVIMVRDQKAERVICAADQRVTDNGDIVSEHCSKLWSYGDYAVGAVGDVGAVCKVGDCIERTPPANFAAAVGALRDLIEHETAECSILLTAKDTMQPMILIDNFGAVVRVGTSFYAIGSGAPYALGYLMNTPAIGYQGIGIDTVRRAIDAASTFRTDVGPGHFATTIVL